MIGLFLILTHTYAHQDIDEGKIPWEDSDEEEDADSQSEQAASKRAAAASSSEGKGKEKPKEKGKEKETATATQTQTQTQAQAQEESSEWMKLTAWELRQVRRTRNVKEAPIYGQKNLMQCRCAHALAGRVRGAQRLLVGLFCLLAGLFCLLAGLFCPFC